MENTETAHAEQPEAIELTVDLNDLDGKIEEMLLSLSPERRPSPEIEALMEKMIDPPFDEAARVLESYRGRYKGQRCFIIGNGPSLRAEDLEKIKGEFSIASNHIDRIFDRTSWRPRVYTGVDENLFRDTFQKVSDLDMELKLCALLPTDKMYPIKGCLPLKLISRMDWVVDGLLPPFSDDITDCVYHAMTISYINMQIAAFMGFSEVILTGFDHKFPQQWQIAKEVLENKDKYRNSVELPGRMYKVKGMENPEFYPSDYSKSAYCIEEVTRAYQAARNYAEAHNIHMINATRGGNLEVFERVNFDKLMQHKTVVPASVPAKQDTAKQGWMKKARKGGKK